MMAKAHAPDEALLHTLNRMTTAELQALGSELAAALSKAQMDPMRDITSANAGTPKDPFVQRLAADRLRHLRGPLRRREEGDLSYEQIGDLYGVSRERVRQVFEKVCPLEYSQQKQQKAG